MLPDKAARPPGRLPGNVDCALPLDVPVPDLLTANYTFVNERLAGEDAAPNILEVTAPEIAAPTFTSTPTLPFASGQLAHS